MTPETKSDWLITAYTFDGKGGGKKLSPSEISKTLPRQSFWVHLNSQEEETRKWLEKTAKLDPIIVSALLEEETRPRVNEMGDGTLIILRGVNLNENAEPEDMVSIRVFINEKGVFTTRRRMLKAIADIEGDIGKKQGPRTSGDFVSLLIHRLVDRMQPTFTALEEAVEDVEEMVEREEETNIIRNKLVDLRQQSVAFRRYLLPQRDAIAKLRMNPPKWMRPRNQLEIQEAYDRNLRILEELDEGRERIQIIRDEIANNLANELNEKMYLLSIIAALFLPLGFLTGLLGINVAGIPGAEYKFAFWIFIVFLVVVVGFQIFLFKRKKWF